MKKTTGTQHNIDVSHGHPEKISQQKERVHSIQYHLYDAQKQAN